MSVHVYTDGAVKSNPSPVAAYGCWVNVHGRASWGEGVYLNGDGGAVAVVTNNVAEYRGIVRGLELALEALAHDDVTDGVLYADSEFAIKQITGEYACTKEHLRVLRDRARALLVLAPKPLRLVHIMRESNSLADAMANAAIDARAYVTTRRVVVTSDGETVSQTRPPAARGVKRRR